MTKDTQNKMLLKALDERRKCVFENIFLSTVYVLLKHRKYDQDRCSTVSRSYFFEMKTKMPRWKLKVKTVKLLQGETRGAGENLSPAIRNAYLILIKCYHVISHLELSSRRLHLFFVSRKVVTNISDIFPLFFASAANTNTLREILFHFQCYR